MFPFWVFTQLWYYIFPKITNYILLISVLYLGVLICICGLSLCGTTYGMYLNKKASSGYPLPTILRSIVLIFLARLVCYETGGHKIKPTESTSNHIDNRVVVHKFNNGELAVVNNKLVTTKQSIVPNYVSTLSDNLQIEKKKVVTKEWKIAVNVLNRFLIVVFFTFHCLLMIVYIFL